jgi:hypothetical protein
MTFVPAMWAGWGLVVVITFAIHMYKNRLARDEDDEIFLGEGFEHERAAQAEIIAKVAKVEPVQKVFIWLSALATLFVVGYYIWDIITQFK